jgi:hypothetical protein
MTDKRYLKAISCFNFAEFGDIFGKKIKFKTGDNLDYCTTTPCQYYTLLPEVARTIANTPLGAKPFPLSMEVLRAADKAANIVQIIHADCEWRRRLFNNSLSSWWGEWINIDDTINSMLTDENLQKYLVKNWDSYMIIDANNHKERIISGTITTIEEIIEEIKTGTAKIYLNKFK